MRPDDVMTGFVGISPFEDEPIGGNEDRQSHQETQDEPEHFTIDTEDRAKEFLVFELHHGRHGHTPLASNRSIAIQELSE